MLPGRVRKALARIASALALTPWEAQVSQGAGTVQCVCALVWATGECLAEAWRSTQ